MKTLEFGKKIIIILIFEHNFRKNIILVKISDYLDFR